MLGANTPINVDVERAADKAYTVDAAFDVNVPASIAWEVLTDYEGIGRFVSSIRQSTIKRREPGRVLLEQHGVGRAWIISLPMHVVLEVREHDERVLAFHDVCGKSFSDLRRRVGAFDDRRRHARDVSPEGRPDRPATRDARQVCDQRQRQDAAR